MKTKSHHGFTLIELVVVIAILGILAGIAIPRFMDAQATARGSKILADMRTLESALNLYSINNTVPASDTKLTFLKSYMKYNTIPVVPTGKARFPKGFETDLDSTINYYALQKTSSTNTYQIILYDPSVPKTLPINISYLESEIAW